MYFTSFDENIYHSIGLIGKFSLIKYSFISLIVNCPSCNKEAKRAAEDFPRVKASLMCLKLPATHEAITGIGTLSEIDLVSSMSYPF